MKAWLKYGLIGLFIGIILPIGILSLGEGLELEIVESYFLLFDFTNCGNEWGCGLVIFPIFFLSHIVPLTLIGILVGWIIGKRKSGVLNQ